MNRGLGRTFWKSWDSPSEQTSDEQPASRRTLRCGPPLNSTDAGLKLTSLK